MDAPESQEQGAAAPPLGITPDFEDPPNRNSQILAVAGFTIAISTLFVGLRTYTRLVLIKRHGWEDYLLWISWLLSLAYEVMMPLGIPYKFGVHQWDVTQSTYHELLLRIYITEIFYSPVAVMLKIAILIQLYHIFVVSRRGRLYWLIIFLAVFTVVFYTAVMIARLLACIPREKFWNPSLEGTCINSSGLILASSPVNVVIDFALLLIPVVQTMKLQVDRSRKLFIVTIFGMGFIGCFASIMRLVATVKVYPSQDLTYDLLDVGLWCAAELSAGTICCCLPVMPQFYRTHFSPLILTLTNRTATTGRKPQPSTSYGLSISRPSRLPSARDAADPRRNSYIEIDDDDDNTQSALKGANRTEPSLSNPWNVYPADNSSVYATAASPRESTRELELGQIKTTKTFGIESCGLR